MVLSTDILLILSADLALGHRIKTLLAPFGWQCPQVGEIAAAGEMAADLQPAVILLDLDMPDAAQVPAAIRQLPVPHNGTPILTLGSPEHEAALPGRHLDPSFSDAALLDRLRQWAGPLDDHALRAEPWGPRYRMLRLLGLDAADAMLLRLRESLGTAMDALAADGEAVAAHRLAGVAGLCGFTELGALWSRVSHGEEGALDDAVEASQAAILELDRMLAS